MNRDGINLIDSYERAVDAIISENIIESVIEGPPGTGKTTIVPTTLAKLGFKVFTVIPTKIGVYGAHNYVTSDHVHLLPSSIKANSGTAANSNVRYRNNKIMNTRAFLYNSTADLGKDTQLVYCTPGHIKKVELDLIKYGATFPTSKNIKFCDFLIIDEAHLESIDIDFAIKYWKYMCRIFGPNNVPKLIKMSATTTKMTGVHFKYDEVSDFKRAFVYLDNFKTVFTVPKSLREENRRFDEVVAFVPTLIKEYILYAIDEDVEAGVEPKGTMLVFLSGLSDIKKVARELRTLSDYEIGTHEILFAHSSISQVELDKLAMPRPAKVDWRIILATNMCETSVTIPDVKYVIDSMQERISVNGNNDVVYLKTDWISKLSARQRAGRTGRTSDGIVVRCCYKSQYEAMNEKRESEISRLSVTTEVLHALNANVDIKILLPELNNRQIRRILSELSSYCCLLKCGEFYNITDIGKFVSKIPLSAKNATFLAYWTKMSADLFPGIVIACAIENVDTLFDGLIPKKTSNVPLGTLLEPFIKLWEKHRRLKPSEERIRKHIEPYGIKYDGFYECLRRIHEILKILQQDGYDGCEIFPFDIEDSLELALPCIKRVYSEMVLRSGNLYINASNVEVDDETKKPKKVEEYELSNIFLSYGVQYPETVYAITFNNARSNRKGVKQNISLWVPNDYIFKRDIIEENIDEEVVDEESEDEESEEDENPIDLEEYENDVIVMDDQSKNNNNEDDEIHTANDDNHLDLSEGDNKKISSNTTDFDM